MNDRERIAELEAQVERLERSLAQTQDLRRDAVAARAAETDKLRQSRKQLEQLRGRRAVRMALDLLEPIATDRRDGPAAAVVRPPWVASGASGWSRDNGQPSGAHPRRSARSPPPSGATWLRRSWSAGRWSRS